MQLVELQKSVASDPSVALVGISYDPIKVLSDFSNGRGITFPLLSDVGSRKLGELGLLSDITHSDLDYWGFEKSARHDRLPYPGVFLLDEDGVVVGKKFERSHRNRTSASVLLRALGDNSGPAEIVQTASRPGMAVRASVADAVVFPNQVFNVDLAFAVAEGRHVYVAPSPNGYRTLDIEIADSEGVFWESPTIPPGHFFEIPALGDTFSVVEGNFEIAVPVHLHESLAEAVIEVTVSFQVCDEKSCDLPDEVVLHLPVGIRPKG